MGDGGYRPAYNVQFATDTQSQVIIGVEVVNIGSDQGQLQPMVDQLQYRYDHVPGEMLVDGGFVNLECIEEVTEKGCTVYTPVPKPRNTTRDPHEPLSTDTSVIASWRKRMGMPKRRRSTRNWHPARSASMPTRETEGCTNCRYEGGGRSERSSCGTPWLRT